MKPIHPGEILIKEFLEPIGITQYRLAKDISVVPRRINEIVHGKRSITADTALRLSRYFGTSERFWLNLQTRYDMELQKDLLGDRLQKEVVIPINKHSGRQQHRQSNCCRQADTAREHSLRVVPVRLRVSYIPSRLILLFQRTAWHHIASSS